MKRKYRKKLNIQYGFKITTIHQPSAELFFLMDGSLLLQFKLEQGSLLLDGRFALAPIQVRTGIPSCSNSTLISVHFVRKTLMKSCFALT
jgi:hypothetical protein